MTSTVRARAPNNPLSSVHAPTAGGMCCLEALAARVTPWRCDGESNVKFRVEWIVICGVGATVALACTLYALNPFGAPDLSLTGRLFGFRAFRQASSSMEPTIHQGAYFFVRAYG